VPVATGVVGDALVVAVITLLDVPAQNSGAAAGDCPQDALLFRDDVAKPMLVTFGHLCQLQRRALDWHHGVGGVVSGIAGGCGVA
jgi:hypothetical protein